MGTDLDWLSTKAHKSIIKKWKREYNIRTFKAKFRFIKKAYRTLFV